MMKEQDQMLKELVPQVRREREREREREGETIAFCSLMFLTDSLYSLVIVTVAFCSLVFLTVAFWVEGMCLSFLSLDFRVREPHQSCQVRVSEGEVSG